MEAMRFSSSGEPDMASAPCSTKALRRNTSRETPVSFSPAVWASSQSTGMPVPVRTAENSRMGAEGERLVRVSVMSIPWELSSMEPSMGVPDQGA